MNLSEFSGAEEFYSLDEKAIIALAQHNDDEAMTYIIKQYKGLVRTIAKSYYISGADKEDLIQEGMIGLYKAVRDYNFAKLSSFRFFAELCVTRQIQTAVKSASRRKHEPLNSYISISKPSYNEENEDGIMESYHAVNQQNPEDLFISREDYRNAEDAIFSVLSDFEQEVLSHYLTGKSYLDISAALNCSEKSVDNAIQRIKKKSVRHLKYEK